MNKAIIALIKKIADEHGIDLNESIATSQGNEVKQENAPEIAPIVEPKAEIVTAEPTPEVKETPEVTADVQEETKVEVQEKPDLSHYTPDNWDDALIVTREIGSFKTSEDINASDKLYVSFAVANYGTVPAENFKIIFYLDDKIKKTFNIDSLKNGNYRYFEDEAIGTLDSGIHEFKMVIDEESDVDETTKGNNAYLKSITVSGSGETKEGTIKVAEVKEVKAEVKEINDEIKEVKDTIRTDDKATEKNDATETAKDTIRTDDKATEKNDAVENAKDNNKVANNDALNPGQEDALQTIFDEEKSKEDSLKVSASKDLVVLAKKLSSFSKPLTAKQQNAIAKACLIIAEKLNQ